VTTNRLQEVGGERKKRERVDMVSPGIPRTESRGRTEVRERGPEKQATFFGHAFRWTGGGIRRCWGGITGASVAERITGRLHDLA